MTPVNVRWNLESGRRPFETLLNGMSADLNPSLSVISRAVWQPIMAQAGVMLTPSGLAQPKKITTEITTRSVYTMRYRVSAVFSICL